MLQLQNVTPFAAERAVQFDRHGGHLWVVVVKATYDLHADGTLSLSKQQEPVKTHPEYFGEPGHSTLRRDAEIVFAHPGAPSWSTVRHTHPKMNRCVSSMSASRSGRYIESSGCSARVVGILGYSDCV
ncbi:DUF2169 domain-containing protein [Burkholderia cepacia]|nr:DUF2169 domain-containing protein [Burkholderia cepacia]